MASTYVNDLRLNEMATGDASGSWGTVTNTNLELIAEAFSFGTEAITTNADTHTTTIADGASDPGRSMFLKYTGTLDSACTITIAPNTVSKLWFIENGTSGSQNIIISQGSGANITIPPGDTKAIYSDGAGSGAAMVDAFASLSVVDLKVQDDLTVTDDLIVGGDIDLEGSIDVNGTANLDIVDIDGAVNMATTALVTGVLTTTAKAVSNGGIGMPDDAKLTFGGTGTGDLQIYHDGTHSYISDQGTGNLKILGAADVRIVKSDDSELSAKFVMDGAVELYHNNVKKFETTAAGVNITGGFAAVQESTVLIADGQADNEYAFQIKNEEATDDRSYGLLIHAGSTATDRALAINTHDGNAALFYVQGNGQALFTDGSASLPSITNNGDTNTGMYFNGADSLAFSTGGVQRAFLTATQLNVTGNAIFGGSAHTFAGSATVANNLTLTDGNLVVGTAGHGIDFSAQTQSSATTTSELLNHYEQGTFTPTLKNTSGTEVNAYTSQTGFYVRIGAMVHAHGYIIANGIGSTGGSNTVKLGGFPFAAVNVTNGHASMNVGYAEGLNITAGQNLGGFLGPNATSAQMLIYDDTSGVTSLLFSELSDNGGFMYSISYNAV